MKEYHDESQDKDWEQISELIRRTDCVPDAPDCRAAVMARIAKPKPVWRLGWAYSTGFAALLVAAIFFTPFLLNSGEKDRIASVSQIKRSVPTPRIQPEKTLYASAPKPPMPPSVQRVAKSKHVMMAMATPSPAKTRSSGVTRTIIPELRSDYYSHDDVAVPNNAKSVKGDKDDTAISDTGYTVHPEDARDSTDARSAAAADHLAAAPLPSRPAVAKPVEHSVIGTPIAIAMVTWPSNTQPNDSYDYAYTNRDTATGDVTECRVKRSGNSVEIYLESNPAVAEPPVKGSLEHDTTPNA